MAERVSVYVIQYRQAGDERWQTCSIYEQAYSEAQQQYQDLTENFPRYQWQMREILVDAQGEQTA